MVIRMSQKSETKTENTHPTNMIPITFNVKGTIELLEDKLQQIDKGKTHTTSPFLDSNSSENKQFLFQLLAMLKEYEARGIETVEASEVQKRLSQYSNMFEYLVELL